MRRWLIALLTSAVVLGFAPRGSRSVEAAPVPVVKTETVHLALYGLT